nr:AMP-binding protein [Phaeovulum sp. NW3]
MGRALADRYSIGPDDRIWLDGTLTDPSTWLILAAAFYAGCPISFEAQGATIAWHLRGGPPITGDTLRLVHLRAGRDTLASLQRSRPDLTVVNGLTLAEAGGLPLCSDPRDPAATVAATVGRPLHGMEVMIVDPRTGMDMLLYETGEVWLRGPGVMAGFANGIAPFEPARFLRTGILGFLDSEGRLVLSRSEEEALLALPH